MALELQGVSRTVNGQVHIRSANLRLEPGVINVLLGPTAAGKTSLMRLMAGLDRPSAGRILVSGTDVTGAAVQERDVAMVYQEFINYPGKSVYENIASPLRLKGKAGQEVDAAVRSTAELLKLTPLLQRKPLELSGGQQQRCALARALVKQARLVLLDEPLANLDYKLREELRAEIPNIFAQSQTIFVYATSEPEEALLLGGNTATLHEGEVCQFGPTASVYRRPATIRSAEVFSDPPINLAVGDKMGPALKLEDGHSIELAPELVGLSDGRYTLGFRAHDLTLQAPDSGYLRFDCQLTGTEVTGSETFLYLAQADRSWVGRLPGVLSRPVGETIAVWVNPQHFYLFDATGRLVACGSEPA